MDSSDLRPTEALRLEAGELWRDVTSHRFTDELAAATISPQVMRNYLLQASTHRSSSSQDLPSLLKDPLRLRLPSPLTPHLFYSHQLASPPSLDLLVMMACSTCRTTAL